METGGILTCDGGNLIRIKDQIDIDVAKEWTGIEKKNGKILTLGKEKGESQLSWAVTFPKVKRGGN